MQVGAGANSLAEVAAQGHSLSIPLYVKRPTAGSERRDERSLRELWGEWEASGRTFWKEMDSLVEMLDELAPPKID